MMPKSGIKKLNESYLKEKYADFNGNPVERWEYIEVAVQCGEWKTNKAKFLLLKTGPRVCRLLGGGYIAESAIGTSTEAKHDRNDEHRAGNKTKWLVK